VTRVETASTKVIYRPRLVVHVQQLTWLIATKTEYQSTLIKGGELLDTYIGL